MQCYKHKATKVTMFLLAHLLLRTTMNMEFSELSAGVIRLFTMIITAIRSTKVLILIDFFVNGNEHGL